jgi:hypothetical protein
VHSSVPVSALSSSDNSFIYERIYVWAPDNIYFICGIHVPA